MGTKEYKFEVDGAVFSTSDKTFDGRQVRASADLAPASDFVLIQVLDQVGRSIGLEDPVEFERGEIAKFRSFNSDRIFTFTVNERGWEWGAKSISAMELRQLAGIDDDEVIVLDGDRDKVIPHDGQVNLKRQGVEHIVTKRPTELTIIVNGREHLVDPGQISFEQLVVLAFTNPPSGPNVCLTVTFRKGPRHCPEGSLQPSETVRVKEGMIFNVRSTDKS